MAYFYDSLYENDLSDLPENLSKADCAEILKAYFTAYDQNDDKDGWFARIKALCEPLGYTPNVKEYKKNPDAFKGHVGDVSTVIRVAITGRRNTPDLYSILQILGEDTVRARLSAAMKALES